MAWKKRKAKVMDGEVCEPSPWRINQNEFTSEFNGFLDSDNFKNHSIEAKHIKRDTFAKVLMNQRFAQYAYVFSHFQGGWTNVADFLARESDETRWHGIGNSTSRNKIVHKTYGITFYPFEEGDDHVATVPDIKTDDHRVATACSIVTSEDIESSGMSDPAEGYPLLRYREQHYNDTRYSSYFQPYGYDSSTKMPFYKFKADVDSMLLAECSATVTWLPFLGSLNEPSDLYKSAYTLDHEVSEGSVPKIGGKKRYFLTDNPYYFSNPDGEDRNTDMWILCSQFRLTVDGETISKTGFMGPELVSHPIYLTGSTPITAGEHTLQLEARFVWFNPAKGRVRPSSGGNYKQDVEDLDAELFLRIDCSVRYPNLIAQIRSR
tara:strand:- start:767 stop:1897 length:1131 start_codon:yes stop_codon:yes gene_type:complete